MADPPAQSEDVPTHMSATGAAPVRAPLPARPRAMMDGSVPPFAAAQGTNSRIRGSVSMPPPGSFAYGRAMHMRMPPAMMPQQPTVVPHVQPRALRARAPAPVTVNPLDTLDSAAAGARPEWKILVRPDSPPEPSPPRGRTVQDLGRIRDRKQCNCKNSKCIMLYCECFTSGEYCMDTCNCVGCANNTEHDSERAQAVNSILERNPAAFKPKIGAAAVKDAEVGAVTRHTKGCHCKKSNCLKKYCECFQGGTTCTDMCRCTDCKNLSIHADLRTSADVPDIPVAVETARTSKKRTVVQREEVDEGTALAAVRRLYLRSVTDKVASRLLQLMCVSASEAIDSNEDQGAGAERAVLTELHGFLTSVIGAADASIAAEQLRTLVRSLGDVKDEPDTTAGHVHSNSPVATPTRGKNSRRATPQSSAKKRAKR